MINAICWAEYGRSFKNSVAAIPKSPEKQIPPGSEGFGEFVESTIIDIHNKAKAAGIDIVKQNEWTRRSMGAWIGTFTGMGGFTTNITYKVKPMKVRVKKKQAVAMVLGEQAFSRSLLSRIIDSNNPSSVGTRVMLFKPSRDIYNITLAFLNA